MIGILFIVIAVILVLLRSLIRPSKHEPPKIPGAGIVKKRIQENARVCFLVEFIDQNGQTYIGESIPYKSTKGKYFEGEEVKIQYYFSPKGRPFVILDDCELVSWGKEAETAGAIMLFFAVALILLGVICLVAHFFV